MIAGFDPYQIRRQLRQELGRHIKQTFGSWKNLTLVCELKGPQLSKIFRNYQGMTLANLDTMTAALGLPVGHFYPLYKGDCFSIYHGRLHLRTFLTFVRTCLHLHKDDLASEMLTLMLEHQPVKSEILLQQAEEWYHALPDANLLPFYRAVMEKGERVTEPMVIAYYRHFLLLRKQGTSWKATGALYQLLPHLTLLPEPYSDPSGHTVNLKRDAYRQVVSYFHLLEEWDDLLFYAREWEKVAIHVGDDAARSEALRYQAEATTTTRDETGGIQV